MDLPRSTTLRAVDARTPQESNLMSQTPAGSNGQLFFQCMRDLFISFIHGRKSQICILGDNLAAHLSVDVVNFAVSHTIKFLYPSLNSSHLLQLLNVAVFKTIKYAWKTVLLNFCRECRQTEPIQKEYLIFDCSNYEKNSSHDFSNQVSCM